MTTVIFQVVRVAFFAEGADADEAKAAGADIVGGVELVEEIASNEPTLIATMMLYLHSKCYTKKRNSCPLDILCNDFSISKFLIFGFGLNFFLFVCGFI